MTNEAERSPLSRKSRPSIFALSNFVWRISQRIKCDSMPIACALGGRARKTLFVLLADSINPDECRAKKSGRIDVMDVAVGGAGWP